jgi:ATP-dependent exoDNAse (exonuclease V) beta subunit
MPPDCDFGLTVSQMRLRPEQTFCGLKPKLSTSNPRIATLKAAAGFHGESAKVFLGWLDARAGERDFDRRPDPAANSAEAVEIVTWHACKGREWPITVVAEFDHGIEEWPG